MSDRTAPPPLPSDRPARADRRAILGWCLYDWANSAFPAVVTTFVFATYFSQSVAADEAAAQSQWGFMQGAAAAAIAILSPVLGAIADRGRTRKPWLAALTAVCVAASALLWFVAPQPDDALLLLVLVGVAVVGFEVAIVFYNAMLPGVAPPHLIGRVSGWGWGTGYIGGLVCMALILFGFVMVDTPPFGLDRDTAEHVRIAGPIAALWMALFAIPIFLMTPDRRAQGEPLGTAIGNGLRLLWGTLRGLHRHRNIAWFLLARMLYIDGINTLFIFGGIYAATVFGLVSEQVLIFGMVLNVTAGLGALGFAWIDDWIGAKPTVLIAVGAIFAIGVPLLIVESTLWFWVLGSLLGVFFGPAQAASRSLMARLVPPDKETEMFGLYALSGKATAFLGPWIVGVVTAAFDSQRLGMATVLPFLLVGGVLLLFLVREPRRDRTRGTESLV